MNNQGCVEVSSKQSGGGGGPFKNCPFVQLVGWSIIIDEKIPRIPHVYKLKTFNNKILTRSFYEQEIQWVKENEFPINTFEVLEFYKEKILIKKLNEEKAEPYWVNKKQFLNE